MRKSKRAGDWFARLTAFPEGQTGFSRWVTLLCLGLVLLCGTVQAEHQHPNDPGSPETHAACSLCATAHVGVDAAIAPGLEPVATVIGQTEPWYAAPAFVTTRHFDRYTRPPPSDPTLA